MYNVKQHLLYVVSIFVKILLALQGWLKTQTDCDFINLIEQSIFDVK